MHARSIVVQTNVTIPLNVTAPDRCHNNPRQMSQPTTNATILPRQLSQPTTNVTTLPRQMSQLCLDKKLCLDKCHSQRQMSQLCLDKCRSQRQISQHYHDYQRQMSQPHDKCQSSYHLDWLSHSLVCRILYLVRDL